ncbi:hypothetical protein CHUAL_007033 [Chamberlinius hualienensis]
MTSLNHLYLAILIFIGTYCALSTTLIAASSRFDYDVPSPEAIASLQLGDEASRAEVVQRLESLLRALSRGGSSPSEYDYGSLGLSKRQVRYHQCYFNPISCFRRRK